MFSKFTLISLVVGALSVNALTIPVARSPSPEPQGKFPQSSSDVRHNLIFASFTSVGGGSYGGSDSMSTSGGGYGGGSNGGTDSMSSGYYGGSYGDMGSG